MYNRIEEYKKYTLDMIEIIDSTPDYQYKVAELLDKRQAIIDSFLASDEMARFRVLYEEYNLTALDDELRTLLTDELNKTKDDIIEQKKKRVANSAYTKINREGFNIFSTHI